MSLIFRSLHTLTVQNGIHLFCILQHMVLNDVYISSLFTDLDAVVAFISTVFFRLLTFSL